MSKIRPLPEHLRKMAIEELHEVPERIDEDIEALRLWINQEPHLNARTDDQFLVAFLRGCKYSLEKAKAKIESYYTLKTKYPDFYTIQDVDSPRVMEILRLGVGVRLPIPLNETGPRITLIRPGIYPADKFKFDEIMSVSWAMQELGMVFDDQANICGTIDLLDFSASTPAHLFQMTPTVAKKMTTFSEHAMPIRQKGTHFIHTSKSFDTVFNMFKPLMPQKQQERLFVHGDRLEDLYKYIPQKYLPKEYGGENGSIAEIIEQSVQIFLEHRDYLIEDQKYRTSEQLRTSRTIDYDSIFGIEGSFRKLAVD